LLTCGRYRHCVWPIWCMLWPISFVADVVADIVCSRWCLWLISSFPKWKLVLKILSCRPESTAFILWDSGHFVKYEQWERFSGGDERRGAKNQTPKASKGGQWGIVFPFQADYGVWGTSWAPPAGSGSELRPKMNLISLLLWVLYWWQLCWWFWGACFIIHPSIHLFVSDSKAHKNSTLKH